jgi:hypothetical protein
VLKTIATDYVVSKNESTHKVGMVSGDPHTHHSAERVAKEDRWSHSFSKKSDNVLRILRNAIALRHVSGFAVPTQVGSINMPSPREAGDQRQKNLPSPA